MSRPAGIHPTAQIDPGARLGEGTTVGAFSVIGPEVTLGPECAVHSHVVIHGPTTIGARNRIFPFACVGMEPQDLKYRAERSALEIGDDNTIREAVSLHRGTSGGGGTTRIGSHNLLMVGTHVGHDSQVGDHVIFANAATLGGHVSVENGAHLGAYSGVHQFCRIGEHAYIGGYSVVTQDALPYILTVGNRAKSYGINVIGLERKKFTPETIRALRAAYRILFRSRLSLDAAVARIDSELPGQPEVARLVSFIRSSRRGVIR